MLGLYNMQLKLLPADFQSRCHLLEENLPRLQVFHFSLPHRLSSMQMKYENLLVLLKKKKKNYNAAMIPHYIS